MKIYLIALISCASVIASAQNGITWSPGGNISASSYGNFHPRISVDAEGNPLVIWGKSSDQSVYFSRWTGSMFTTPAKLNPTWLPVAMASWMGPDIASKGDTVYVVVRQTPESSDTNQHIYLLRSFDGGRSFSSPLRVEYIADSVCRFPAVAVDAIGNPVVAFMKFNSTFRESRWVVARSTDYGDTFSTDVKASGWGNSAEVCDCCPGSIITSGSTTALLYRDNNRNIRDCWSGISDDNAVSFTRGYALENNRWNINSCPASGPDGVIYGESIYSVFMNGASGKYRNYVSVSSISSGNLSAVSKLTEEMPGLSQQNFPRIANDAGAMAIVWKQTVNSIAELPILFTKDIAIGFPSSYELVDVADITNTDVAMSNERIYVVWQDDKSGTVKFRSGSYSAVTSGIQHVKKRTFSAFPNPTNNILTIIPPESGVFAVQLFNVSGESIFCRQSASSIELNTSDFRKGMYFIQLSSSTATFIEKLIIR